MSISDREIEDKKFYSDTTPFINKMFPSISRDEKLCIAIVGGGGKTSLLHQFGKEFAEYFSRVLVTTLTRSGVYKNYEYLMLDELNQSDFPSISTQQNPLFLAKSLTNPQKYLGLESEELFAIKDFFDQVIFECDGSRNLPLKKHNNTDQRVPSFATHAIILVGAEVVGTRIEDGLVHRPELFMQAWNVDWEYKLTADFIANILTSDIGYLEVIPVGIPKIYFVNKAEKYPENAFKLAESIKSKTKYPVFYGSVEQKQITEYK